MLAATFAAATLMLGCSVVTRIASDERVAVASSPSQTTSEKASHLDQHPDTPYAVSGVVEVSRPADSGLSAKDLLAYVPESDMTQYFEQNIPGTMTTMTRYIWAPYTEESALCGYIDDDAYLVICIMSDPVNSCLVTDDSISQKPWLIVPGERLNVSGRSFETPPYLFTVTTPARAFEDCMCCVTTADYNGEAVTTASFIAPGVGCVLQTTNYNSPDFYVMLQLTGAKAGIDEAQYDPIRQGDVTPQPEATADSDAVEYDSYDEWDRAMSSQIFPDSDSRYLSDSDYAFLIRAYADVPQALGIARNEIYARHGNIFDKDEYRNYFGAFDWYEPTHKVSDTELNEFEKANIQTIRAWEAQW